MAPARRPLVPHLAAGPARLGRRRRHERVRAPAGGRRWPAPASTVDVYTRADDPSAARGRRGGARSARPPHRGRAARPGAQARAARSSSPSSSTGSRPGSAVTIRPTRIHANYWLSGVAGHELKHRFDLPLGCTFHTLARVKGARRRPTPPTASRGRGGRSSGARTSIVRVLPGRGRAAAPPVRRRSRAGRDRVLPASTTRSSGPGRGPGRRRAIGVAAEAGPRPVRRAHPAPQGPRRRGRRVRAAPARDGRRSWSSAGPAAPTGCAYLDGVTGAGRRSASPTASAGSRPQPHELLASYYRAADVVLVPSQSESFGLVALEAAACGTPVVATAVGGLHTLVLDGRTGFLRPRAAGGLRRGRRCHSRRPRPA